MSDRRSWHIDRSIPLAVIAMGVVMVIQVSRDQSKQDERISLVENSIQMLQQSRISDQQRSEKKFDELKTDLRLINGKLDRLIEGDGSGR
ncbi:hypothetical protein [Marinobacter sp. CA1]|uniref:hypothetical protein n=1 Tax=Marinobacter sp. CA1 TaxID=2817656 RepID=UPI001D0808B2|nr:hypothetical protein [Marinobacter sp. CA1]UDL03977.1 hypothetical protein J2887_14810 [Marinobacter sp. CA1]